MSNSQTHVTYRPPEEGDPPFGGIAGVPQADLDRAAWDRLPAHLKTSVIGHPDRYAVPKAWRDEHATAVHDDLDQKDDTRRDLAGLEPLKPGEVDPHAIVRDGVPARPEPAKTKTTTAPKAPERSEKEATDG